MAFATVPRRALSVVAVAAALLTRCASPVGAPGTGGSPAVTCPAASPGGRTAVLRGSGNATTARFAACGDWTADLDWRCPDQGSFVTTEIRGDDGSRQVGPRGDGPVGMAIRNYNGRGRYRLTVTTQAACTWSIDIIAGRI